MKLPSPNPKEGQDERAEMMDAKRLYCASVGVHGLAIDRTPYGPTFEAGYLAGRDSLAAKLREKERQLEDARVIAERAITFAAADGPLPRHDPPDRPFDLRQRTKRAIRWLREAEDIARIEMPAWPTADRIRDIYEQITEDVLNGKTSVPPLRAQIDQALSRAAIAEQDCERVETALREWLEARDALAADHNFTDETDSTEMRAVLDPLVRRCIGAERAARQALKGADDG